MKFFLKFASLNYFLFVIILAAGCSNKKSNELSNQDLIKPYPHYINLREGLENQVQLKLSEIADSIRYVVLSKSKQILLKNIRNIQITDSNIYLISDNLVMRFDISGRFLNSFGGIGRGPQEYLRGSIYTTTPEDDRIYILRSALFSYLSFAPNGNYRGVKDFPVPRTLFDFRYISDSVFLCTFYYIGNIMKEHIENSIDILSGLYDLKGNQIKILDHPLKNSSLSPSETRNVISPAPLFTFFNNRAVLFPEGDTVYEVTSNSITKGFIIEWGSLPHKHTIEQLYLNETGSSSQISIFEPLLETSRKAFFRVKKSEEYCIFEYDKVTQSSRSMPVDFYNIGFINDLDGGKNYYPDWNNRRGDIWIAVEDAYSFKEHYTNELLSNSDVTRSRNNEMLRVFCDNLEQDDNPVLKIVYLKK